MTPETARLARAAIDAARALKKVGLAQGDIDAFDAIRLEITAAIEALQPHTKWTRPTSSDPRAIYNPLVMAVGISAACPAQPTTAQRTVMPETTELVEVRARLKLFAGLAERHIAWGEEAQGFPLNFKLLLRVVQEALSSIERHESCVGVRSCPEVEGVLRAWQP